jgi:macrolide transport system ATP-binding/permease protein
LMPILAAIRRSSRSLRTEPVTVVTCAAILAAGVSVAASALAVVYALLIAPIPVIAAAPELYRIDGIAHFPGYEGLKSIGGPEVSAYRRTRVTLSNGKVIVAECVTPDYFRTLGVELWLGDGGTLAARNVRQVIVGHTIWRQSFLSGADPRGQTLELDGKGYLVVGVTPSEFVGIGAEPAEAFISLLGAPSECSPTGRDLLQSTSASWLRIFVRIPPHHKVEGLGNVLAQLGASETPTGAASFSPLFDIHARWRQNDGSIAVWAATGSVAFFLICITSLAGILALRALAKADQWSIRGTIGATWRQLAFESGIDSFGLLSVGCLFIPLGVAGSRQYLASAVPALAGYPIQAAILAGLAVGLTLIAVSLAAAGPMVVAVRCGWGQSLQASKRLSKPIVRDVVFATQVTLAIALLQIGSVCFTSLERIVEGVGVQAEGVLLASRIAPNSSPSPSQPAGLKSLSEIMLREPGRVQAVAISSGTLLGEGKSNLAVAVRSPLTGNSAAPIADAVTPSYFEVVGTDLVAGRPFTVSDDASAAPVAIVSEALARKLWNDIPPIGTCLEIGVHPCVALVGVSRDRRSLNVTVRSDELFVPLSQAQTQGLALNPQLIIVKLHKGVSQRDGAAWLGKLAAQSGGAPFQVTALSDLVDTRTRRWRLLVAIFGPLGLGGTVLTALAVGGAVAHRFRQRTFEISVRIALGAQVSSILALLARRSLLVTLASLVCGTMVSAAALAWAKTGIYGVSQLSTTEIISAGSILLMAFAAALLGPYRRTVALNIVGYLKQP